MKYPLFIFIYVLIISCNSSKKLSSPKEFEVYGFDFRKYADSGFLFTPLTIIDRPYDGRGMIRIIGYPEVNQTVTRFANYANSTVSPVFEFKETPLKPSEIIDKAYEIAKSFGADAVIQFELRNIKSTRNNVEVNGLELTGFAIKRR